LRVINFVVPKFHGRIVQRNRDGGSSWEGFVYVSFFSFPWLLSSCAQSVSYWFFFIWVVHCPVCYCVILLSGKKNILFFSNNKNRKSFLDFSNFFISF
jgi:hypothetical protein